MRNSILRHQNEREYRIVEPKKPAIVHPTGWVRKAWAALKRVAPMLYPVTDKSGIHHNALHNGKRPFQRPTFAIGKPTRNGQAHLTQHERVVIGRAKRLGISVKEYTRRFQVV